MDTSNNAGGITPQGQRILDVDLLGSTLAADLRLAAFARPDGFKALVKAISQGNRTVEITLLRSWGVWW